MAEKVSILVGALRTVLKRVGLVVHRVDDSIPAAEQYSPAGAAAATASFDASPRSLSDALKQLAHIKVPGLHDMGQPIERALHDAAEYHDSNAVHVAHQAMEDDRLGKSRIAL